MAASTTERVDMVNNSRIQAVGIPVAASTAIFGGVYVGVNVAGHLVPMADAVALTFLGQANGTADNRGGADGALVCMVAPCSEVRFARLNATSPGDSWIGSKVFFTDDNTVAKTSTFSNLAGRVLQVISSAVEGSVLVDLDARQTL